MAQNTAPNTTLKPPWKPGESGNPGGRPKSLAKATRELVGDDGMALAEFWHKLMKNAKAPWNTRMAASLALAERGWGKSAPLPEVKTDDPLGLESADHFLAAVEDELAARRKAKTAGPQAERVVAGTSPNGAAPTDG